MKDFGLKTYPIFLAFVIIFDLSHTFNALRIAMLVVKVWLGAKKHKKTGSFVNCLIICCLCCLCDKIAIVKKHYSAVYDAKVAELRFETCPFAIQNTCIIATKP